MFGYIIANRAEMSDEEITEYRSYYCGLCHSLKERYGSLARLTLNYDLTFVAILLTDLSDWEGSKEVFTCPIHPIRKTQRYRNEFIDYAADMTILLSYYKALDDYHDENKKSMLRLLKKPYEKAKSLYPEKDALIAAKLNELSALEKEDCRDTDLVSGLFGEIMADVMVKEETPESAHLYRMGYYLGKFIYLMDACLDYPEDLKKGLYNPFKGQMREEDIKDVLDDMISQTVGEYSYLPVVKDVRILENILYSGVWLKYDYGMSKRKAGE